MSALLICGTTVGAGILALPIQTGLSGFLPALLGMSIAWGVMLLTGLIISARYQEIDNPEIDLLSLYEHDFGPRIRWVVIPTYLLVFYGMLVAYLSASATVLDNIIPITLPSSAFLLIFFIPSSLVILFGLKLLNRANMAMMLLLGISFLFMICLAGKSIQPSRYTYTDWKFLPSAMPILICSFAYQVIVPTVCRNLHGNRKGIRKALIVGTSLPFLLNFLWIIVVIGVLPLTGEREGTILYAFNNNSPATIPLAIELNSSLITSAGMIFSLAAIFTSFIAVGEGLRNFFRDLFSPFNLQGNGFISALTFVPPLLIALIYPSLFLKALNLVGGVGVVVLFGIIPSFIALKKASRSFTQRIMSYALIAIFALMLILELAQESGRLKIHPAVENWRHSEIETSQHESDAK